MTQENLKILGLDGKFGENGSDRSVEGCIIGQAGNDRGKQLPEEKKV